MRALTDAASNRNVEARQIGDFAIRAGYVAEVRHGRAGND